VQNPFVDNGFASEIAVLEKEYGKGITGDNQRDMTRFQKQVLLKEEARQSEEARPDTGGVNTNPSGVLNAQNPSVGQNTRSETTRYKNKNEFETENQVEFVDTE